MAFKNIPEEKWAEVIDLICDITSVIDEGDTLVADEYTFDLHCMLDDLERAHGAQPIIISTKADFTDDIDEQIGLYEQAINMAEQVNDPICIVQSAESLAQLYIEEIADPEKGTAALTDLKKYVAQYGDEYLCGELAELEQVLHEIS